MMLNNRWMLCFSSSHMEGQSTSSSMQWKRSMSPSVIKRCMQSMPFSIPMPDSSRQKKWVLTRSNSWRRTSMSNNPSKRAITSWFDMSSRLGRLGGGSLRSAAASAASAAAPASSGTGLGACLAGSCLHKGHVSWVLFHRLKQLWCRNWRQHSSCMAPPRQASPSNKQKHRYLVLGISGLKPLNRRLHRSWFMMERWGLKRIVSLYTWRSRGP